MKKIICLIPIIFLILQSCSSGEDATPVVKDDIKPPFIVKYEVSYSSGLKEKRGFTTIQYGSETKLGEYGINFEVNIYDLSKTWTHSFTSTVAKNPLYLVVNTDIEAVNTGNVNFKIYVNNVLVENHTTPVNPRTDISVRRWFGASYWVY